VRDWHDVPPDLFALDVSTQVGRPVLGPRHCSGCGGRWTVKDGHPGVAYVFWPPDIDAAFDNSLEPLFDG
jgi:hypothetical protein